MSASARHSKWQRPRRFANWLRRLGLAALGAALLLLGLYAGLQTAPVKRALVAYLNRSLSRFPHQVRLAGLSGRLPQRPCVRVITCIDAQGPWLRIENARLVWSPLQWFKGQLTVDTLAASQVTVLRRPAFAPNASASDRSAEAFSWLPQIELTQLTLKRVELGPTLLGRPYRFSVAGQADLASQLQDLGAVFHLTGDLSADLKLSWQRHSLSLPEGTVTLDITQQQQHGHVNTAYAMSKNELTLSDLQVNLPGINGYGDLTVEKASGLCAGAFRIELKDAAPLSTLCGHPLQAQGAVDARLSTSQGMQHASVTWDIKDLKQAGLQAESLTGEADLRDLYQQVNGKVKLRGSNIRRDAQTIRQFGLEAQGQLQKGQLAVQATGVYGERFAFAGVTQWQHNDDTLDLTLQPTDITYGTHRITLNQPAGLTVPSATFKSGPYQLQNWQVTADGHEVALAQGALNWSSPVLQVTGNLQLSDNVPMNISADVNLPIQSTQGSVAIGLTRHGVPVKGKIAYVLSDAHITVSMLDCNMPGTDLRGQGVFHTDTQLGQGTLQFQIEDAAPLATFVGHQAQGSLQGRLDLNIREGVQALQGMCEGKDLVWTQAKLDHIVLKAQGDMSKIRVTTTGRVTHHQPFVVDANTILYLGAADKILQLDAASLQYGTQALTLKYPAVLKRQQVPDGDDPHYGLQDCVWDVNGAEVSLDGWYAASSMSLKASLTELDITTLPFRQAADLSGKIKAQVHVTGSLDRPHIQVDADLKDLGPQNTGVTEVTRLNTQLKTTLTHENLKAELAVSTPANDQIWVDANLPIVFGLRPWRWTPKTQDLRLHGTADADVGILDWLPVLREAALQGRIKADLTYTGDITSGSGTVSGQAQWVDGLYEDIQLGTVVRDINARLRARDQELILEQVSASAGQEGRMTAQGRIKLASAEDLSYEIQIKTEQFPWIQRADASIVASGGVNLTGSVRAMLVNGHLHVDRGLVDLAALPPPPPPTLVSFGAEAKPTVQAEIQATQPKLTVQGSLRLDLGGGGNFRVIGSGLDSLWKGNLDFIKADEHWTVAGVLSPYRGDFRMLGRPFRLSDGTIRLDGTHPIVPILDLTAVHRRRGIEARVHMSGRMTDPIIRLEADPPMPEDAILATVLFGKDLATISPLQALQLAAVVRDLHSSSMGGMNLFQRTRQALHVDSIDVKSQDERSDQMAVAVGKYLHPEVYVEVQQPLNNEGVASTRIEYEVRPNLTIETEAGPGIRPGLGLNWKKDY